MKKKRDWLVAFHIFAILGPALAFGQVKDPEPQAGLPRTVPVYDQLAQASGGDRDTVFDAAGQAPTSGLPADAPTVDKSGGVRPEYSEKGNRELGYIQRHPDLMKPAPEPAKASAPGWMTGLGIGVAAAGAGAIGAAVYAGLQHGAILGLAPMLPAALGFIALIAGIVIIAIATSR